MNLSAERLYTCIMRLCEMEKVSSFRQFAMSIDYLPDNLYNILHSSIDLQPDLIRKVCNQYEISYSYITSGSGPMFINESPKSDFRVLTVVTDARNTERIVHVPVPAQAGYVSDLADPVFYSELPTYSLPDFRFSQGTHRSFDVSGDSMEPALFSGDIVICNFIEPNQWTYGIKDDHVYVIVTNTDVVVKRVRNMIRSKRSFLLISDNEYYKPYHVPVENVREVWNVQMRLQTFEHTQYTNPLEDIVNQQNDTIKEQQEMIRFLKQTIEKFCPSE